jgi:hypothetical protein
MNGKFSRPAADTADAHVPLGEADLREIPCFEDERTAANDYVVRFECRLFQILMPLKKGGRGHFYRAKIGVISIAA